MLKHINKTPNLLSSPFKFLLILTVLSSTFFSCEDDDTSTDLPSGEEGEFEFAIDVGDSEIPYVVIDTRNVPIENEPKIIADFSVYENMIKTQTATIGIEFRGATSFRLSDKKSFGIETWDEGGNDIDQSLFGFPEEEDWILMGHVVNQSDNYIFDRTLMYHHVGYEISRQIDKYASRTQFVELELNGEYMGIYVFMEKLKRDNDRIDIARLDPGEIDEENITGGYILKIDKASGGDLNLNQPLEYFENNWDDDARYQEDFSFRSNYDVFGNLIDFPPFDAPYHANQYLETYFLYEYPGADGIAPEQKSYIQNYINEFELALLTDDFDAGERTYTNYIDVSSFIDYFLINELCRNVDAYRLSTFLTKDKGEKLAMGPVWDMNIGFDNGDRVPMDNWVINYNQFVDRDPWMMPFWWPRLLEDAQFRAGVKSRWNQLRSGALSTSNLQSIVNQTANYLTSNGAVDRNYNKWTISTPVDYNSSVASLNNFLRERSEWMDAEIANF